MDGVAIEVFLNWATRVMGREFDKFFPAHTRRVIGCILIRSLNAHERLGAEVRP